MADNGASSCVTETLGAAPTLGRNAVVLQEGVSQGPPYRRGRGRSFFPPPERRGVICQVPGCERSIYKLRGYYKRYKICPYHLELPFLVVENQAIRFCQQCGHFQLLQEFEGDRRSCRSKLSKHNARRRRLGGGGGEAAPPGDPSACLPFAPPQPLSWTLPSATPSPSTASTQGPAPDADAGRAALACFLSHHDAGGEGLTAPPLASRVRLQQRGRGEGAGTLERRPQGSDESVAGSEAPRDRLEDATKHPPPSVVASPNLPLAQTASSALVAGPVPASALVARRGPPLSREELSPALQWLLHTVSCAPSGKLVRPGHALQRAWSRTGAGEGEGAWRDSEPVGEWVGTLDAASEPVQNASLPPCKSRRDPTPQLPTRPRAVHGALDVRSLLPRQDARQSYERGGGGAKTGEFSLPGSLGGGGRSASCRMAAGARGAEVGRGLARFSTAQTLPLQHPPLQHPPPQHPPLQHPPPQHPPPQHPPLQHPLPQHPPAQPLPMHPLPTHPPPPQRRSFSSLPNPQPGPSPVPQLEAASLALKLLSASPAASPAAVRSLLAAQLGVLLSAPARPLSLAARPGCLHLCCTALLFPEERARAEHALDSIAAAASALAVARQGLVAAQLGSCLALARNGRALAAFDLERAPEESLAPSIQALAPLALTVLAPGERGSVLIRGDRLLEPRATLHLRCGDRYVEGCVVRGVQTESNAVFCGIGISGVSNASHASSSSFSPSAASSPSSPPAPSTSIVHLSFVPAVPGYCAVEVQHCNLLAPDAAGVLVLRDASMVAELRQLEAHPAAAAAAQALLPLLAEALGLNPGPPAASAPQRGRLAAELAALALLRGWPCWLEALLESAAALCPGGAAEAAAVANRAVAWTMLEDWLPITLSRLSYQPNLSRLRTCPELRKRGSDAVQVVLRTWSQRHGLAGDSEGPLLGLARGSPPPSRVLAPVETLPEQGWRLAEMPDCARSSAAGMSAPKQVTALLPGPGWTAAVVVASVCSAIHALCTVVLVLSARAAPVAYFRLASAGLRNWSGSTS